MAILQTNLTNQTGSSVSLELKVAGEGASRLSMTLPVNPSEVVIERPSRQAVTQTLTGVYQDHLGSGVTTIQVQGTTGWRGRVRSGQRLSTDGYAAIKALRDLLIMYDDLAAGGDPSRVELHLLLNLPQGWEYFLVSKDTATYSRSDREPQLFRYRARFTALKDMYHPNPVDPSPNFVVTIPAPLPVINYAPTILPDSSGDGDGGSGSRGGNDGTVDDRKLGSSTDNTVSPYVANSAGADAFNYYGYEVGNVTTGDALHGTTGVPSTVGALGEMLYPLYNKAAVGQNRLPPDARVSPLLYPPGMWVYIVQANRNYFVNSFRWDTPLPRYAIGQITAGTSGVSRNEALLSSQITLWIPRVSPAMANPAEVAYTLGVSLAAGGYDYTPTDPSRVEQILDGIGSAAASSSAASGTSFRGTINPLGPGPVSKGGPPVGDLLDDLGTYLFAPQPKSITGGGLY